MYLYDFLKKNYEAFIQMPHHPAYLILGLVLISFLFEDLAVAAGVAISTAGSLLWSESFLAVWFGIALGDLLLYAAGYYSRKILNRYQYLRHFQTSLGTALQILPEKVHCCNYGV